MDDLKENFKHQKQEPALPSGFKLTSPTLDDIIGKLGQVIIFFLVGRWELATIWMIYC